MATDDTITRYWYDGDSLTIDDEGQWVRYEDHQRALTAALRERYEARAGLEAARYSCDHEGLCPFVDTKPDGTR